jgi:hypothetical protein
MESMKISLLNLMFLVSGASIVLGVSRLVAPDQDAFPIYLGMATTILGVACLIQMHSRLKPNESYVRVVEWIVFFTILVQGYWLLSPPIYSVRE